MVEGGGPVQPEVEDRERLAWKRRPFARTFDLIAEQYGWTDDQILDLTMARMRQVRDVIWERRAEENRRHLLLKQTELRTLASFMAQTKEAAAAANKITLVDDEDGTTSAQPKAPTNVIPYEQAVRWFGG